MSIFKKKEQTDYSYASYPQLLEIKPKEKYVFHSDYFQVDDCYATILSFFHNDGATDNFGAFWGINRIPSGLHDDITIVSLEQIRRMTEGWLADHQTASEGIAQMNETEQQKTGTNASKAKASRKKRDLQEIDEELRDGSSYLNVQYRLLVKAPTLEKLDESVKMIYQQYIDRFTTMQAAPYAGEQKNELSNLFRKNEKKKGRGFYFTSKEFAGSYSLVTHGLEDAEGEYVGYMVGDVNNSAVLFHVNGYKHHVVVANENYNMELGRVHVSDMWGSKISQACLLNNHRVVHLILDGANMDQLGPKFTTMTSYIDLNQGDVNMFEMFGDTKDELSIFPAQMQKLILMAEQAYETTENDRSIIRGSLEEIATKYYIENRMWYENAVANRDKLRITGIPHEEVPKLEMFVTYLDSACKALRMSSENDPERLHAMNILRTSFKNMLTNNGDLFNTTTSHVLDDVTHSRRMIYDFSKLKMRGVGVMMAQFVNVLGFAVGNLSDGDTVIIHGAELLDDTIKNYIRLQFDRLWDKGGRVVYLYNNMDKMLSDKSFSQFDKADYTIFGNMTDSFVSDYQKELGQNIPPDLASLITNKSDSICYIRREFDNVVFRQDLTLGLPERKRVR